MVKVVLFEMDEFKSMALTTLMDDMKARYMIERNNLRLVEEMDEGDREKQMGHLAHYAMLCEEFSTTIASAPAVEKSSLYMPKKGRLI